jgi:asparagine synthase (glutamine-hydrolysing)
MCGLAGIVGDGAPDETALHAALDAIRHRGPDELKVWTDGPVGLAHARLSIIDRARGSQPVLTADGRYVAVFNGEIYNHHELRTELTRLGCPMRTTCDSEILPYLYALEGPAMVERLRGMFALAIIDRSEHVVFLARDGFGKKPMYAAPTARSIAFGSTLDAVLPLLGDRPAPNVQAIAEYMVLQYVPAGLSPWTGVEKVEPGHWLRWRAGTTERRAFWHPPLTSDDIVKTVDQAAVRAEVRTHIRDAVACRLESEVPLGVFLSGGLDSSVVVAEMAGLGQRPKTYSVGFQQGDLDERPFAEMVARHFDTDHHELVPDADVVTLFGQMVRAYDEPFADSSALATLAVAQAAADHVTVVLTGDGGDELFAGYDRYRALALGQRIGSALGPLRRPAVAVGRSAARLIHADRLRGATSFVGDPWAAYRDRMFHFMPSEIGGMLADGLSATVDAEAPVRRLDRLWTARSDIEPWVPAVDARTYLPDDLLTKMDRATMAFGVEARSPLLDRDLWSYVATLPRPLLLDHRRGKKILREAYADALPAPILTRPKRGFGVPIAVWMRANLRDVLCDLLVTTDEPVGGLLDPEAVRPLVQGFLAGADRGTNRVWNLLALAGWYEARGSARGV